MNHHEILSTAGGLLALVMFIPMFQQVVREKGAGHSFATWLLWGFLDLILIASLIEQHGNFWIVAGFATGDLALSVLLASQRRFNWGTFETMILALVILCVIGWKTAGPRAATMFSIVAVCVAGVPGYLSLKRSPDRRAALIWLGFAAANALSFFGGTAMTLEQRLAPGVFTGASLLMAWAGWRKTAG
ncbi:MAG TPA: hypothetical protein VK327_00170 [Candidatus Paceibacterota bacterium]|nr:hypothetical protein [Candidatus Paceibacterota bacterium]